MTRASTSPALTFRRLARRDLPAVIELWEAAGWGSLDESTWAGWYEDTPHGPAIVTVVEDEDGAIAGQFAMVPSEVAVPGGRVRGLRSSAVLLREDVILRRQVEGSHSGHPLLGLPAAGFDLARDEGYDARVHVSTPVGAADSPRHVPVWRGTGATREVSVRRDRSFPTLTARTEPCLKRAQSTSSRRSTSPSRATHRRRWRRTALSSVRSTG